MKRYFITGTDTDCGKTYVTTSLLNCFPGSIAIKPIASGCIESEACLISPDAQLLQENCSLSLDEINPWRFKSPVSPHIAAKEHGIRVSVRNIADYCLNLRTDSDLMFVEGAGGLQVPLNDDETWVDFLNLTHMPVLLVVGMKLGCINHALLTVQALLRNKINCAGWVANCIDPAMNSLTENIDTLREWLKIPYLGCCPYKGGLEGISL